MSRRLENASAISDLCNRLGFAIDRDMLQTESGILELLSGIQARLNQLQDQDTYHNVEEIPTDSCPVVHPEPKLRSKNASRTPIVNSVVNSVMTSMISSQLRLMLTAQALDSSSNSMTPSSFKTRVSSSSRQFTTVVEKSLAPLLPEIRSDTLLSEVFTLVVRVASEVVHELRLPANRNARRRDLSEPIVATSPSFTNSPSTHPREYRKTPQSRTSTTSTKSSASTSSFNGFPCFPSPRSSLDNDSRNNRSGSRARSSTSNIRGYGHAKQLSDTASRNNTKRRGVTAAEMAARLLEATNDTNMSSQLMSTNDTIKDSTQKSEITSNSNMEARWRDRPLAARRQDFCWPFEDAYRYPYENDKIIVRDNWQFVKLRSPVCPPFAQLNRSRRADIVKHGRQDAKHRGLEKFASSPFELLNGVPNSAILGAGPSCGRIFFPQ